MKVLAVNCGSSTLKFDVLDVSASTARPARVAAGVVERVGGGARLSFSVTGGAHIERDLALDGHGEAMVESLALLEGEGLLRALEAVGHRVVHGGLRFSAPVLVTDAVLEGIAGMRELAPLHNDPALRAIEASRRVFGERVPMVATFDTAFYAELPEVARRYAIPRELSERHGIRRYGFHGLAHRYMVERYRELRPELEAPRLITLQLGNGCSATASVSGHPIDTSMGFTPLEGLIMGTRSGDVDPSLPLYLVAREALSTSEVDALLNSRSGLLGLSGRSADMRDLLAAAAAGDAGSQLAVEAFSYRARKYVGAYLAALGGADALIFGGGIGEQSAEVRRRICAGLEWAGLVLDPAHNEAGSGQEAARVTTDASTLEAWVVAVDEAAMITRDVVECLDATPRA